MTSQARTEEEGIPRAHPRRRSQACSPSSRPLPARLVSVVEDWPRLGRPAPRINGACAQAWLPLLRVMPAGWPTRSACGSARWPFVPNLWAGSWAEPLAALPPASPPLYLPGLRASSQSSGLSPGPRALVTPQPRPRGLGAPHLLTLLLLLCCSLIFPVPGAAAQKPLGPPPSQDGQRKPRAAPRDLPSSPPPPSTLHPVPPLGTRLPPQHPYPVPPPQYLLCSPAPHTQCRPLGPAVHPPPQDPYPVRGLKN